VHIIGRAFALEVPLAVLAAVGGLASCSVGVGPNGQGGVLIESVDLVPPNASGGQQALSPGLANFIVLGEAIDSSTTSTDASSTISDKHGFYLGVPDDEGYPQHFAN